MYSRSAFQSMIFYNKKVRAMELARLTDYFKRYNIINSMTFIKNITKSNSDPSIHSTL